MGERAAVPSGAPGGRRTSHRTYAPADYLFHRKYKALLAIP